MQCTNETIVVTNDYLHNRWIIAVVYPTIQGILTNYRNQCPHPRDLSFFSHRELFHLATVDRGLGKIRSSRGLANCQRPHFWGIFSTFRIVRRDKERCDGADPPLHTRMHKDIIYMEILHKDSWFFKIFYLTTRARNAEVSWRRSNKKKQARNDVVSRRWLKSNS